MGTIYKSLGLLATDEVLEKSASDLVGQYVGHTGNKTKKLLEIALGKVLLIDEAYRLADGHFAKEATDELVDLLTKPQFAGKLIVILAGYDHDIEGLMATNPGLTSRFPERVAFNPLSPASCVALLISKLAGEKYLDTTAMISVNSSNEITSMFQDLIQLGNWANARDVINLAHKISRGRLQSTDAGGNGLIKVQPLHVKRALQEMINERQQRAALSAENDIKRYAHRANDLLAPLQQSHNAPPPIHVSHTATQQAPAFAKDSTSTHEDEGSPGQAENIAADAATQSRDAGVSDEIWSTLEADKQKAIEESEKLNKTTEMLEEVEKQLSDPCAKDPTDSPNEDDDSEVKAARRKREQERIRYENLRRQKEEMEARQRHEMKIQRKLKAMGICPMGFQWIKQDSGYRCSAGAHFVADATLLGS